MSVISKVLIGVIALAHIYFCYIEMFAWESRGPDVFTFMDPELFPPTAGMAANQGLYNLFLAGGLIWALLIRTQDWQRNVAMYFLFCVLAAGLYGALILPTTLYVQAIPAALALASLFAFRKA
ncbi:DUF1304 domain-containing protein [Tateyamaria sp. SN3-11]|uniref:DUF1304 domain-containing protein n=1 Tax=Tateyamaria sp. SN3-11 TaxID=3092147 RepID=UPI0039E9ED94